MEDYQKYIDAYFNQTLSAEEARQFEQRIMEDKNFAEEVAFYLSAKQVLKEEIMAEKKKRFRELVELNSSPLRKRQIAPVRKLWVYAAAAVVITCIFLGGYILFVKPTSPSQMAKQYIEKNLENLPVTMSTEKDSLQDGLRLYNENQLDSSLKLFESLIRRDTANISAKKYAGIVYLRLGNYDKALAYFQELEKYTSLYSNPATFYHALTLMKRNQPGDKQQARQLLQQVAEQHLEYEETAQQWLLKKW